jgi:hypothetical protein
MLRMASDEEVSSSGGPVHLRLAHRRGVSALGGWVRRDIRQLRILSKGIETHRTFVHWSGVSGQ